MRQDRTNEAFQNAREIIPGGVNSPARAYSGVNSNPPFIEKGSGSKIYDIDGNAYIDFVSSYGPLILGHGHPAIVNAVKSTAEKGTSFGAPTVTENETAQMIIDMVPSIEKIRFVNSGTEATMSSARLARGYTGKDLIVKFGGCFHGHVDSFLIEAGSGAMTQGVPNSPGVTKGTTENTLIATYNDIDSVRRIFEEHGDNIAAVILEPIAGNMGVVPPADGFLEGLREITSDYNALLIFDEVISGFRVARGGAQELYGVTPDITALGKIIGGGLPVGAYGGKKEIMDHVSPEGPVYQSGTLAGNPIAMAAGKAMLTELNKDGVYEELEEKSRRIEEYMRDNIKKTGTKGIINRVGSMMTLFLTDRDKVSSYADVAQSDTDRYNKYIVSLLEKGIYIAPAQFECFFVSQAHSDEDIESFGKIQQEALEELGK